ncbi:universal stress protein [Streptomyces sp. NBC_01142]|uniref:universal stress protein n=1 Tax=Streptomyces sp. NBC_01142 TaxID=2975865 RepID=UPI0022550F1A|nr:universal stress protein [Streptomyces sp. NBC_01142]MCX4825648.1 universal stress protein [Streptomyces sp. NBC_01142]
MERPLVVGVDGSEPSLRAVDWAADEAGLRGAPLRLVNASLWERYEGAALADDLGEPSERVLAEQIVASAAERAGRRNPDLSISTDILPEEAVTALLHEGGSASALVIGSRGRGGISELLVGSVSLAVAARADCPVIVLRGSHENRPGRGIHQRIVLGVDEPPEGSAAVRFAFHAAEVRHAELHAVRAWRRHEPTDHPLLVGESARSYENRAVETVDKALREAVAEHPSVELHRRTVEGSARKVLMDASTTADLLVVGAQRRHGHIGLQLGRVAHAVLHRAVCPVAVVPQRA